ncbi:unnamed protein product [Vicia faba]|uniref:Uncharacterized protein n=1 Tax=Vicia faba TaxID=3906 RepID=A0AAV1B1B2_VICFA|nr:unnamed protein product [Vicia faba]
MTKKYLNFTFEEMMEAGVHFGHDTRKWKLRMTPFISGKHKASKGKHVGTKKAANSVTRAAIRARCHYVIKNGSELWLNATFYEEIKPFRNRKVACPPSQSHILWQHLLTLTPINKGSPNPEVFRLLFTIMLTRVDFTPLMALFHDRQDGPEWFIRAFPPAREDYKKNSLIL